MLDDSIADVREAKILKLLAELAECEDEGDPENGHIKADACLLDFIGDDRVNAAFGALSKWCA